MAMITLKQVATELGCTEQYAGKLANKGLLAGEKHGRVWRIDSASVRAFALSRTGEIPVVAPERAASAALAPDTAATAPAGFPARRGRSGESYEQVVAENERLRAVVAHMAAAMAGYAGVA